MPGIEQLVTGLVAGSADAALLKSNIKRVVELSTSRTPLAVWLDFLDTLTPDAKSDWENGRSLSNDVRRYILLFYFTLLYQFYVGVRSEFGTAADIGAATPLRIAIGIPASGAPTPITDIDDAVDRLLEGAVVPPAPISDPVLEDEYVIDDYGIAPLFDEGGDDDDDEEAEFRPDVVAMPFDVGDVPRAWHRSEEIAAQVARLTMETQFEQAALKTEYRSATVVRYAMPIALGVQQLDGSNDISRKKHVLLAAVKVRGAYCKLQHEAQQLLDRPESEVSETLRNNVMDRRQRALVMAQTAYRAAMNDTALTAALVPRLTTALDDSDWHVDQVTEARRTSKAGGRKLRSLIPNR